MQPLMNDSKTGGSIIIRITQCHEAAKEEVVPCVSYCEELTPRAG